MRSFYFTLGPGLAGGMVFALCLSFTAAPAAPAPASWLVYFGTYTGTKSQGIYRARFDSNTGKLTAPELAAETKNPSFLALHPNREFLYAVGEITSFAGQRAGAVSAFKIAPGTGALTLLNQQASGGTGPCHVAVDASGRCVLVANYGSGSIASLPILPSGELGAATTVIQHQGSSVNEKRQAGPHAHFIVPDPRNRRALVCDLGLDKVLVYKLDPAPATLEPNDPAFVTVAPGAGPRHLAIHPRGRLIFVVNELNSTVTVMKYAARSGALEALQTVSTIPAGFTDPTTCAGIDIPPSGKFLYASNRGHDSIAVFAVDSRTGSLTPVEHQSTLGKTPRHFAVAPDGRWLLAENQGSDTVVVFRLDEKTGALEPTGQQVEVGSPVCAVFLEPSGRPGKR